MLPPTPQATPSSQVGGFRSKFGKYNMQPTQPVFKQFKQHFLLAESLRISSFVVANVVG